MPVFVTEDYICFAAEDWIEKYMKRHGGDTMGKYQMGFNG